MFNFTFKLHELHFYNHFQLESLKRLALISNLVDPIHKTQISSFINQHKKLNQIQPMDKYMEMNRIINNVLIFLSII